MVRDLVRCRLLSATALASILSIANAHAAGLPSGGHYVSGKGDIGKAGQSLTVKQSSTTGIIDWNKFSVGSKNSVAFGNGHGATLNRVTGGNLSTIAGSLHATGSLYIMNNAGVIVSGTGRIVTGGDFVATSGNIGTAFDSESKFKAGAGKIVNKGTIVSGGSTTLAGSDVHEAGTIHATSVDLQATHKLSIDGVVAARNGNSGGTVTARAGSIVIGTDGVIDASATGAGLKGGTISVVARGTTTVEGKLKAEGGVNGTGGFVDTSGEHVHVADGARISTVAANGKTGTWLIDPQDFTIAASGGDITGAALSNELGSNDISIKSSGGIQSGNGDIFVNDAVTWVSGHTLTLDAYRNIMFNAAVTITGAGGLTLIVGDRAQDGTPNTADGDYFFDGGNVAFTSVSSGNDTSLKINGQAYTLENSISDLATAIAGAPSGFYALANNYDASGDNGGAAYTSTPIPTTFEGTFEGLGNAIDSLTIDDTSDSDVSLFAHIDVSGTVRDIGLTNVNISGSGDFTGGLAAENDGTIMQSHVTGSVSSTAGNAVVGGLVGMSTGEITQSDASASVMGGVGSAAGGLVGDSSGTISGSNATGAVTLTDADGFGEAGGLVGENAGTIEGSFATGAVLSTEDPTISTGDAIGGLAGANDPGASITGSYATGNVTETAPLGLAGGLVGANGGAITTSYSQTGIVTAVDGSLAGGLVGDNGGGVPATITDSYSSETVTAGKASWVGGLVGYNELGATISGSTLGGTYATGAVSVSYGIRCGCGDIDFSYIGGLVGENEGTITNATTSGQTIKTRPFTYAGGLVGDNGIAGGFDSSFGLLDDAKIQTSTSSDAIGGGAADDIVGGLAGGNELDASITGSSASGRVLGRSQVGGLVGFNIGSVSGSNASGKVLGFESAGGLIGESEGSVTSSFATGTVTGEITPGSGSSGNPSAIGGLIGQMDSGSVSGSYATGDVNAVGGEQVGGLIGYVIPNNNATVDSSHATGNVTAPVDMNDSGGESIGGLIGDNGGQVTNSYATGNIVGEQNVGGLIGFNENDAPGTDATAPIGDGTVVDSFATGAVTGDANSIDLGGLIGANSGGVKNTYALGSVTGGDLLGGLAGESEGSLYDSFSIGEVRAASGASPTELGALIGEDDSFDNADIYWDTQTSGITDPTAGAGDMPSDTGTAGKTTKQLQAALQTGFSSSSWGLIKNESFPYLTSIFTGTPQVISGTIFTGVGGSVVDDASVTLLVNGASLASVTSYADGSYYELAPAGTLSNAQLFAYATASGGGSGSGGAGAGKVRILGATLADSLSSSMTGLNLYGTYLDEITPDADYSEVVANLATAVGANSFARLAANSEPNLILDASAASFDIDGAINRSGGTVVLEGAGGNSINQDSAITAGNLLLEGDTNFTLSNGANNIVTLAASGIQALTVDDNRSLTIGSVLGVSGIDAGGGVELTTNSGAIIISQQLTASNHPLTLDSAGRIAETGAGAIRTSLLGGSAGSSVTLDAANNAIGGLGDFSVTGASSLSLTDAVSLVVSGTVNTGTHDVALTTTGTGHTIQIQGTLEAGQVSLASAAGISESNVGAIDASALTGSSAGSTTLNGPNTITDLDDFTVSGIGSFSLTDTAALTVDGALTSGGSIFLTTTGSGNSISIRQAIGAPGTVALVATGGINESGAGEIGAGKLLGSSVNATMLNSATNTIAELGAFSTNGAAAFGLTDDRALEVDGAIDTGTGPITLTTVGADSDLAIDGAITGGVVNLVTTGAATESGAGAITAATLNVTANTGIVLNSARNAIAKLGTDTTNSGPNNVKL